MAGDNGFEQFSWEWNRRAPLSLFLFASPLSFFLAFGAWPFFFRQVRDFSMTTVRKKLHDDRGAIVQYFERPQFYAQAIRRGEKREKERVFEVPDNVSLSGHWCWTRTDGIEVCVNAASGMSGSAHCHFFAISFIALMSYTASFVISSPRIHVPQHVKHLIAYTEC